MSSTRCPLFLVFRIFCIVLITSGMMALFLLHSVRRPKNILSMKEGLRDLEETRSSEGLQRSSIGTKRSTIVLVVASMRTGSSLLGNIIQKSPSVFYVFEPLYAIDKLIEGRIFKTFAVDGSFIKLKRKKSQRAILEALFTCDFSKMEIYTMLQHHMILSNSTHEYFNCSSSVTNLSSLRKCIIPMEERCRSSDIISTKVIRLKMKDAKYLISKFPELKVVHLIRDPRGKLLSTRRMGKLGGHFINASTAKTECERVTEDLDLAQALKKKFPDRLFTMRYEDLALTPLGLSRELYDFIGLPFAEDISDFVRDITWNNITNCGAMCTIKNSTYTVFKWRHKLTTKELYTIDNNCLRLYRKAGYLPLERSEIDDLSVSPLAELPKYLRWDPKT